MSTPDRHDGPLAPWHPEPTPAIGAPAGWDEAYDPAGPAAEPARKLSARVVARAIRRNWWQILLVWTIASGALVTLVFLKVKPNYDAIAYVRIEPPNTNNPIANVAGNSGTIESQLETQVQRMTTPDILGVAIKDPKVTNLPRIQASLDPEALLRKELKVQVVPKTRYITVGMTSQSSDEAVAIVNAVARAYETSVANQADIDSRKQTQRLERFLTELNRQVEEKRSALTALVNRIDPGDAENLLNSDQNALDKAKEQESISLEEFKASAGMLNSVELSLMEEEKRLDRLKTQQRQAMESIKLEKAVDQELQSNAEVGRLAEEYDRAEQQYERAMKLVHPGDPSLLAAKERVKTVKGRYRDRVARLRPLIRQKLERATSGIGEKEVFEAQDRVATLQTRREGLQAKMRALKVDMNRSKRITQKDSLEYELARQDHNYSLGLRDRVKQELDARQMDIENQSSKVYVTLAAPSLLATVNNRTKLMAAAPVGTLAVVVALFVLLEMGAGRVADPDDLQGRLRLGVIGVVPPLPTAEPVRGALPWGNGPERARRRVEEFVQSLDHLRVQIWAGRRAGSGHRVVLITSACVSEGKTTLSAQLAGRCANAGMATLLIDADLRRPALAKLLEVPASPGLADVLAGEVEPEGAMTVIGNAGGFHLMPAGRRGGDSGRDPGRLLEGAKLGELLARLRETFDIIIVDAPPVLPVPDALILGRHTDGAILAVRHDSSRYPLVERAKQKLASVGVPILGAVVNGVRGGSSYGNYAYSSAQAGGDGPA